MGVESIIVSGAPIDLKPLEAKVEEMKQELKGDIAKVQGVVETIKTDVISIKEK